MLAVHVSSASVPPSGSGWLPGIVPWKVKPVDHAVRREPQLPTTARQWTRVTAAPQTGVAKACATTSRTARDMRPCPRASGCSPKPSSPADGAAPGRRSMVPA